MSRASKRMNFLIDEAVSRELEQLVPPGKRSQVVNEALRGELERIRRKKAVERLLEASSEIKKLSTREIIDGLAKERSSH